MLSAYELVLDKAGPKLRESGLGPEAIEATGPGPKTRDTQGFPVVPPGLAGLFETYGPGPHAYWIAHDQPISELVIHLRQPLAANRLVVDRTSLTGKYDFTLGFDLGDTDISIFDALRQQLGLRLVDVKQSLEIIVIDRVDKVPTDN